MGHVMGSLGFADSQPAGWEVGEVGFILDSRFFIQNVRKRTFGHVSLGGEWVRRRPQHFLQLWSSEREVFPVAGLFEAGREWVLHAASPIPTPRCQAGELRPRKGLTSKWAHGAGVVASTSADLASHLLAPISGGAHTCAGPPLQEGNLLPRRQPWSQEWVYCQSGSFLAAFCAKPF